MMPAMKAALSSPAALIFGAVEIALPGHTMRLLDGAGAVMIGGNLFTGRDDTYGTLSAIRDLTDGDGDQAPTLSITLLPSSNAAVADLAAASHQGSPVRIWMGVVDRATGTVIADPELLFLGELDVPTLSWDKGVREIEYEIVSVFERFFDLEEGARLSDSFHQSIWPGERGLEFITGVTQRVYWGLLAPAGAAVSYSGGGSFSSTLAYALRSNQQ